MNKKNLLKQGIYAAILTPLNQDLSCNIQELVYHSLNLMKRGCSGIALFGTTGEGPSFSVQERIQTLNEIIAGGVLPEQIILGNGSANIPDTVALSRAALTHQIAAMLIAPPSFYKNISDDGVIAYYSEIIHQVANPDLRILLYHIPQCSGVPITLKIIDALRTAFPDSIIGIKESEGNIGLTKAIIDTFPQFLVYAGKEMHIREACYYGAVGSICGIANIYPELACSLLTLSKKPEDVNCANIEALFQIIRQYPFIPVCKAILKAKRGDIWHSIRPPFLPLHPDDARTCIACLEQILY